MFDDEDATYEELMRLDDNNFEKGNGFNEEKLRKLRTESFRPINFKAKEACSICMTEFKAGESFPVWLFR